MIAIRRVTPLVVGGGEGDGEGEGDEGAGDGEGDGDGDVVGEQPCGPSAEGPGQRGVSTLKL